MMFKNRILARMVYEGNEFYGKFGICSQFIDARHTQENHVRSNKSVVNIYTGWR